MRTTVQDGERQVSRWILICCAVVTMFCAATLLHSQAAGTASIQGVATDSSGAVVPNAKITATDVATQVKHVTKTDGQGLYSFPSIPIGSYSIDATAPGFSHYHQTGIILDVGSSIAVNIVLRIGNAQETVEVQAQGLSLQTEDSTLKQTVDSKTLTEMPLNGRQMTDLVALMGGAISVPSGDTADIVGSKTFYSSVEISIAGGQGNYTDYRLDGADNNDYMTNINLPFPFPDAVAEFSVESTDMGANEGLHPGGLVNVVTKSGTNQYHGTAFEFIRNNYIDSTSFFSVSPDQLHQNQFGGVFGGPIMRNKLFGFAGYQHTILHQAQANSIAYVPTAANLQGDFSLSDGAGCPGGPIQLVNPQTGALLNNNQINPTIYFNAAALELVKYFPTPTNDCGLVTYAIPNETSENQFVTREDWTINQKNSAYGRYWYDYYQHPSFFSPTNILITNSRGNFEQVQGLALGETWLPTSRFVNNAHASISLRNIRRGSAATGINADTIGVTAYQAAPNYLPAQATGKWQTYNGGAPGDFVENTISFSDDINWIHGKHQFGFGGELTRSEFNENNVYQGNGAFTFSGIFSETGPNGTSTGGTGEDANLDFLTGAMGNFEQSAPQLDALRAPIPTLYAMDTYHANKKLVITGGVRWNPEFFPADKFGRGSTFSMANFLDGIQSTTYTNAPARSLFYGDPGVPKAFTNSSKDLFSPRLGITFDPTGSGKTVFRIGGSMVYDLVCFFMGQNMNENPPFSESVQNVPVNAPLSFSAPWSSGSVTTNPFPQPNVPAHNIAFPTSAQYIILAKHFDPPMMTQYTASVQRELGRGWEVQADFIGNRTSHNSYSIPMSNAVYIPGMCGSSPCSTTSNEASRFSLTLQNPTWGPYYAGGGQESVFVLTGANASYDGLIMTVQHRTGNLVFMSNYTYSHCIDIEDSQGDTEGVTVQNPNDILADKGNCGFDYRHVFNMSLVASSHFSLPNRFLSETINNWQIAPLIHAQDGTPFTVVDGIDNSLTDTGNDRPDLTGSPVYTGKKIAGGSASNGSYINAAAFVNSPTGTFGTLGRNTFRGPKFLQFDSALVRTFPVHESMNLMLRLEAFNVLNHPNFDLPDTTMTDSTFGDVTSTVSNYSARIFQGAIKFSF